MKFFLRFLPLFLTFNGWGQTIRPTVDYVSQLGSTLTTPLYVNLNGEVKLKITGQENLIFPFLLQVGYSQLNVSVIYPKVGQPLDVFEAAPEDASRLITKRKSFEFGLGMGIIQSSLAGVISVAAGLTPYVGGFWEAINVPETKLEDGEFWKIPVKKDLWDRWAKGEARTYQLYGGVSFFVGANISIVSLGQYIHSYQGRYDVKIEKINTDTALVRVRRENWDKDAFNVGAPVLNAQLEHLRFWDRERHYYLDMRNERHVKAMAQLWAGSLVPLQKLADLVEFDHRNFWVGNQQTAYVGIPWVAGKIFSRSMLQRINKDESEHLWMLSFFEANTGLALNARTKRTIMSYQPSQKAFNAMISFERNKTTLNMLQKDVFAFIERMSNGREDFQIPDEKLGYSLSTISLGFKEEQINHWMENISKLDGQKYKLICIERVLSCAKKFRAFNRVQRLKKLVKKILKVENKTKREKLLITFTGYLFKRPALWSELLAVSGDSLKMTLTYVGSKFYPYRKEFVVPRLKTLGPL